LSCVFEFIQKNQEPRQYWDRLAPSHVSQFEDEMNVQIISSFKSPAKKFLVLSLMWLSVQILVPSLRWIFVQNLVLSPRWTLVQIIGPKLLNINVFQNILQSTTVYEICRDLPLFRYLSLRNSSFT